MKKKMMLGVLCIAMLLGGCGEKQDSANMGKNDSVQMKNEKKVEAQKEASEFPIQCSDFEQVGNNPNNLMHGGQMVFDENYMYFFRDQGLYRADYAGEEVTQLADVSGSSMNLYGEYLYFAGGNIKRYHLPSGKIETVKDTDKMEDREVSGTVYRAYHTMSNLFIAGDYLFFEDSQGYNGTDQQRKRVLSAIDLRDMTEYPEIDEIERINEEPRYSFDGEYVYTIRKDVKRIALSAIKEGAKMEDVASVKCEYEDSVLIGTDGFCCIDDEGDTNKYYVYFFRDMKSENENDSFGTRTEFANISEIEYLPYDIYDGRGFVLGNTYYNLTYSRNLHCCKNMDFANSESYDGFEFAQNVGVHEDKLYIIGESQTNKLTIADAEGNVTYKGMEIPEAE